VQLEIKDPATGQLIPATRSQLNDLVMWERSDSFR